MRNGKGRGERGVERRGVEAGCCYAQRTRRGTAVERLGSDCARSGMCHTRQ